MFGNLLKTLQQNLWKLGSLLLALAVYALILLGREPLLLRPLSVAARYSFTLVAPVVFVWGWLFFQLPERVGRWLRLPATLAVFGLALAGLWASGQSELYVVSGLLPWTDASNYYQDALRLMNGGLFSAFTARRPLFAGLLAVLLQVCGGNLQMTFAVLTLLVGVSCWMLAEEVRRSHGSAAAALAWLVLFFYYRRFSGTTMTENLGVALGAAGFALLWRSTFSRQRGLALAGLLAVTVALNARAGAFFVLPFIALWLGWAWRGSRRFSWGAFGAALGAVAAGFLVNFILFWLLASPEGVPFANFSYSFYGLVTGGGGWGQIGQDHPEVLRLAEPLRSQRIYALSFEALRSDPWGIVRGALYYWRMLFSNSWYGAYAYVGGENVALRGVVGLALFVLCAVGLVCWARSPHDKRLMLVGAGTLGVLVSVPFVPPTDAHLMRAYAATQPVLALLPAVGLAWLLQPLDRLLQRLQLPWASLQKIATRFMQPVRSTPETVRSGWGLGYTLGLLAVCALGPLLLYSLARPVNPAAHCAPGQAAALMRYAPGSSIRVIKEDVLQLDWMPEFHQSRFRRWVHGLTDARAAAEFEQIQAPVTVMTGIDLRTQRLVWLVAAQELLPETYGLLAVCGQWSSNTDVAEYHFLYAQGIERVGD